MAFANGAPGCTIRVNVFDGKAADSRPRRNPVHGPNGNQREPFRDFRLASSLIAAVCRSPTSVTLTGGGHSRYRWSPGKLEADRSQERIQVLAEALIQTVEFAQRFPSASARSRFLNLPCWTSSMLERRRLLKPVGIMASGRRNP
jgi:hypothetical protein